MKKKKKICAPRTESPESLMDRLARFAAEAGLSVSELKAYCLLLATTGQSHEELYEAAVRRSQRRIMALYLKEYAATWTLDASFIANAEPRAWVAWECELARRPRND